jgi:hypothetical protein
VYTVVRSADDAADEADDEAGNEEADDDDERDRDDAGTPPTLGTRRLTPGRAQLDHHDRRSPRHA